MRAAVYVRRSTDEHQAASLLVQEEEALRFASSRGWTVDPTHIYREDAVSRAEFKKRPALIAMLNSADQKAFDVVITRDETRLGGDMIRTGLLVQELLDRGIQLFYYFTGEQVRLEDATSKFLLAARNFASELEREKISQRTREHLATKARRGLNTGGRCFGYDNVEIKDGDRRRHVEYRVNQKEAKVVRSMFLMYSRERIGLKGIVKALNAQHIPSPRAGKRGTGSWSPSVVRVMLRNERYRGVLLWGRVAKTYRGGTKVRDRRAANDPLIMRTERPDLRIVDDDLWFETQAKFAARPVTNPSGPGRPAKHLLSGISVCGRCGGPIVATRGRQGKTAIQVYGCGWHRVRGDEVCASTLRRPVTEVNAQVADWVRKNILSEQFIVETIRELRGRLVARTRSLAGDLRGMELEAGKLRRELDRLISALAGSDEKPDAIVQAIAERQSRLRVLEARLRAAKAAPEALSAEAARIEREALRRIGELDAAFDANLDEARAFLAALFPGKLMWRPVQTRSGPRYELRGDAVIGPATVLPGGFHKWASPAGVEPALAT